MGGSTAFEPAQRGLARGHIAASQVDGCNAFWERVETRFVAPVALAVSVSVAVGANLYGVGQIGFKAGEGVGGVGLLHEDEVVFVAVEADLPLGLAFCARHPGESGLVGGQLGGNNGQAGGLDTGGSQIHFDIVYSQVIVAARTTLIFEGDLASGRSMAEQHFHLCQCGGL